jgi:hypothetical protein
MMMMKAVTYSIIFMMVIALIFYLFFAIEYALKYMLMPDLVPLIWFLFALPTPFWATALMSTLMTLYE